TISKSLNRLKENNFIEIELKYSGKKTSNVYTILDIVVTKEDESDVKNINITEPSDVKNINNGMASDVKNINPNYTLKNINYTKNNNTLSKDKVCGKQVSTNQKTLIDIPKPLETPKKKK